MKKLPLGTQDFKDLRQWDMLYVDKTQAIYRLIKSKNIVFLSRPRRFGKSLLLSTIEYLFRGEKELFEGLYIYDKIEWKEYPVIRLDFSEIEYTKGEELFRLSIQLNLTQTASEYGIELPQFPSLKMIFTYLIKALHKTTGQKVILLIDEYDKPVVDLWESNQNSKDNQEVLADLFASLKGLGSYLRFVMFTGITKVAKVSVFSKLNNVTDISLDDTYSTLLGITQKELEANFQEYFPLLERKLRVNRTELLEGLKAWYNGYSWDAETTLYNPYGLLLVMQQREFSSYWFESGTPKFLINRMKSMSRIDITGFERVECNTLDKNQLNWKQTPLIKLLFQTGYLTILGKDPRFSGVNYTLGYPNNEVRLAFLNQLMTVFQEEEVESMYSIIHKLQTSLYQEDCPTFIQVLKSFYANIPYNLHIKAERFYHALFLAFMKMLNMEVEGEILTDVGRIDSVLKLSNQIYILEFKYAEKGTSLQPLVTRALTQIQSKRYAEKYKDDPRKLLYMGIAFDGDEIVGQLIEA